VITIIPILFSDLKNLPRHPARFFRSRKKSRGKPRDSMQIPANYFGEGQGTRRERDEDSIVYAARSAPE
jgi:hypothetical protein